MLKYRPPHRRRTVDRAETAKQRAAFARVRRAEKQYAAKLRKVARHVGDIIKNHPLGSVGAMERLREALKKYADVIKPWAEVSATRMIADVARRDERAWAENGIAMGRALRDEIERAPTGLFLREKLAENVKLITSLPTEAGERVHKLTLEAMQDGTRASEIAKEIARSGEVTISRANTIARTEVSRTATGLLEARSKSIGSEGYIWRTVGDSDVRPSHRAMNGKFVRWDSPPTLDKMTGHAGQFPNCRCYCEPVVPDDF